VFSITQSKHLFGQTFLQKNNMPAKAKERKSADGPPNTSKGLKTKNGPTVQPFLGLTPRTHNILSYATTSLLFTLALLTMLPSGLDGMTSGQAVILFCWNIHFVRRTAEVNA
jgi:hypothetical protein